MFIQKIKIIVLSLCCLLGYCTTFAQTRQPFGKQMNMKVDFTKLQSNITHYVMKVKNKKVGSWEWEVERTGQTIRFKDISILDGQVREDALITFDTRLMEVTAMEVKMKYNTAVMTGKIKASRAHLKADYVLQRGEQTRNKQIDTTIHHWVARPLLIGLMPYITWKAKQVPDIAVFSLASASFWKMQIEVLGEETIQVPAGTFQTQKIALRSQDPGSVSNIFYISKGFPRKLVRVDVVGRDMQIELVK
ncbi:MAG TPA: hypothetical protein DCS93_37110 [Microscillaceae bacterium]|nr:hypothetical protein [Microscillaceae bacterium]